MFWILISDYILPQPVEFVLFLRSTYASIGTPIKDQSHRESTFYVNLSALRVRRDYRNYLFGKSEISLNSDIKIATVQLV